MPKTTVVVVDDSALIRALLTEIINSQADMEVIGVAADPYQAREIIRSLNPDVITLDVEMPRMDGLDFLEKIMRLRPMPVVMVSTDDLQRIPAAVPGTVSHRGGTVLWGRPQRADALLAAVPSLKPASGP